MEKKIELLRIILDQSGYVTNNELQTILDISRRTIVNYVNEINQQYGNIIGSTNKGYQLVNKGKAMAVLNSEKQGTIPQDYNGRKMYVLKKLLLTRNHPTVDELAAELCISPITFMNEISKLRSELKEYHLYIKLKNNHLFIIAEENEKRKFIMLLLNQELESTHFNKDSLQKFFIKTNIAHIENIVTDTMYKHEFFLDDFSLLNYVLHLAICIESADMESPSELETTHSSNLTFQYSPDISSIIEDIFRKLKAEYDFNYTVNHIYDASILMATRIVSQSLKKLTFQQIDDIVDNDIKKLLLKIITSVHDTYGIDLKADSFMVRFVIHLKNAILRTSNQLSLPRNSFISIKEDYPFLYVIAVYIGSIINKEMNCTLSENEISYIALHLGVLMEEKKAYSKKITSVLVIYDYYNLGAVIFRNINQYFDNLLLLDIVTSYEQIDPDEDIDLILTVIPPCESLDIMQVKINMIPTQQDYQNILSALEDIKRNISRREITNKIKRFFHKDLFFFGTKFNEYHEVIEFMCDTMMERDYVNENYKEAIYEHENFVSSAYRDIAIPHPLSAQADQIHTSSIAVLINEKPIQWIDSKVNIVLMLSLRKEDNTWFRDIFGYITESVSSQESLQQLLQCRDFDSFIDFLIIRNI